MDWSLKLVTLEDLDASRLAVDRNVCGLNLPLRLALSAQQAGASCVELAPELAALMPRLRDPRLLIPIIVGERTSPLVQFRVRVPWNLVVHRDLFKDLVASLPDTSVRASRYEVIERDLWKRPHRFDPPFGFAPVLVKDKESARRAERALLVSLRKLQDGWTSTYLNRYISLWLTRWLSRTPLHPNVLSVLILAVGLTGAYLASTGQYWMVLAGVLLFKCQSVLDGCDGELARLTYRTSHAGQWFDTIGDDVTNYAFYVGLAWGLYTSTGSMVYLVAGAVVVGCGALTSGIEYCYLIKIGSGDLLQYPLGIGKAPGGDRSEASRGTLARLVDGVSPLFKRDSFVLLTVIAVALGLSGPLLFVFAAGAVGILIAVLRAQWRIAKTGQ